MAKHVFFFFCFLTLLSPSFLDQVVDEKCRIEDYSSHALSKERDVSGNAVICENTQLNKLPFLHSFKCDEDESSCEVKGTDVKAL